MAETTALIDTILKALGLFTAIGAPIGGAWRLSKQRTFATRLELSITGEILRADGDVFLRVAPNLKNIGASRVELSPSVSYVRICQLEMTQVNPVLEQVHLMTVPVLVGSHMLESSESVGDLQVVKIPDANCLALHLEFGVTSTGTAGIVGRDWTQTAIIDCKLKKEG